MAPRRRLVHNASSSQQAASSSQQSSFSSSQRYVRPTQEDPEEEEEEEQEEEYEEEEEVTSTQARKRKGATSSRGGGRKKKKADEDGEFNGKVNDFGGTSDDEIEQLLGNLMRFCLFKDTNKLPIKRDDVATAVLGERYKKRKGLLDHLISLAQERFLKIFGFELLEIDRHDPNADVTTKSTATQTASQKKQKNPKKKSTGIWMLRLAPADNGLPMLSMSKKEQRESNFKSIQNKREEFDSFSGIEQAHLGLLMVIVCLIETKKNRLAEEDLWKYLSRMNIHKGKSHPVFGLPEKLVQQFEKQFYLEKNKNEQAMKTRDSSSILYIYQRGSRLRKELLNSEQILHFMADLTGFQLDPTTEREFLNAHGNDEEEDEIEEAEEEHVAPTPTPPQPQQAQSRLINNNRR
ncbi:hypothetical protein C9374_014436 [Naegleria lovaniensis]|uniref:MAGE domain-containing protein n=1 Tax=Naegleria lovaniensis TaxID=51637 RepID=A0AA88KPW1_NAELO|nr:uncharacterized protein C9374_014436 [Naegleria lovaniensis]KAG2389036.1 hypothetical protein C9374_014436 [Naegleria lovaniensis]